MGSNPNLPGADRRPGILYSFPHALGAPGIGWTARNQVVELVELGFDVHLVAASMAEPVSGLASLTTTLSKGRVRIPARAIGRSRAFALHDAIAARTVARRRPDVVHGWPLASARTFRAAAQLGIPSLREAPNTHTRHAYEVVAEECARIGVALPRGTSHDFDERRLAVEQVEWDAATAILVPSDSVARTFQERGFDSAKLIRHQYGYQPSRFPSAPLRPVDRPLQAVFLGRGEPRKGLHFALRAWLDSVASDSGRLLIYGDMQPAYARYLRPLLEHPSVEVRGFTADPAAVLGAADVMLLPSIEEGSALITYEAQAAGCIPLVSTAAGAVLEHGTHGLLHTAGDVPTLTAQLDLLARDTGLRARLSENARAHAPELTWTVAAERLAAAYDTAISMTRSARVAVS